MGTYGGHAKRWVVWFSMSFKWKQTGRRDHVLFPSSIFLHFGEKTKRYLDFPPTFPMCISVFSRSPLFFLQGDAVELSRMERCNGKTGRVGFREEGKNDLGNIRISV